MRPAMQTAMVCAPVKWRSTCRRIRMRRSTLSAASARPGNARESDVVCTVELDPRWAPGLQGLETVSHVVLLYWMDKARRDLVVQCPRHYDEPRGTFALRSPARPNPVALSVAKLLRVDGNKLSVVGVDCLDDTPLLDIKPYFASTDSVPDAVVGWHASRKR